MPRRLQCAIPHVEIDRDNPAKARCFDKAGRLPDGAGQIQRIVDDGDRSASKDANQLVVHGSPAAERFQREAEQRDAKRRQIGIELRGLEFPRDVANTAKPAVELLVFEGLDFWINHRDGLWGMADEACDRQASAPYFKDVAAALQEMRRENLADRRSGTRQMGKTPVRGDPV